MEEEKGIFSEFAIASLVLGIISFVHLFSFEKSIAAIVFGILALRRIEKNSLLRGKKLAVAGLALGIIAIIAITVLIIKYYPELKIMQEKLAK